MQMLEIWSPSLAQNIIWWMTFDLWPQDWRMFWRTAWENRSKLQTWLRIKFLFLFETTLAWRTVSLSCKDDSFMTMIITFRRQLVTFRQKIWKETMNIAVNQTQSIKLLEPQNTGKITRRTRQSIRKKDKQACYKTDTTKYLIKRTDSPGSR